MSAISQTRQQFSTALSGGWLQRLFGWPGPDPFPPDFPGTSEQSACLRRRGLIVWCAIAQANTILYCHGNRNAPANVVFALDFTYDERPEDLVAIAQAVFKLKNTTPENADLAEVARMISNETNFVSEFVLPTSLTGGARVLMTTTMVTRSCLPGSVLSGPFFPLLIDPTDLSISCVLPVRFWPADLATQWREAARSAPVDEEQSDAEEGVKAASWARKLADRGELVRFTPRAVAELRRQGVGQSRAVEIRLIYTGKHFCHEMTLVERNKECDFTCQCNGVEVHVIAGIWAFLLQSAEVDYSRSTGDFSLTLSDSQIKE